MNGICAICGNSPILLDCPDGGICVSPAVIKPSHLHCQDHWLPASNQKPECDFKKWKYCSLCRLLQGLERSAAWITSLVRPGKCFGGPPNVAYQHHQHKGKDLLDCHVCGLSLVGMALNNAHMYTPPFGPRNVGLCNFYWISKPLSPEHLYNSIFVSPQVYCNIFNFLKICTVGPASYSCHLMWESNLDNITKHIPFLIPGNPWTRRGGPLLKQVKWERIRVRIRIVWGLILVRKGWVSAVATSKNSQSFLAP